MHKCYKLQIELILIFSDIIRHDDEDEDLVMLKRTFSITPCFLSYFLMQITYSNTVHRSSSSSFQSGFSS